MRIHRLISVFLIILFLASPVFANEEKQGAIKYNIIIIDITSLRPDHLSCNGYFRRTSPFIDQIAKEGVWFKQAVSQAYWTLPSVTSIFTSKYPFSHRVTERNQKLDDSYVTLAEILRNNDYKTAAFVGGLDLDKAHNLDKGFDVYFCDTSDKPMGSFAENLPKAFNWLKENINNNLFLFIQGYDIHPPFQPPLEYENIFDAGYKGIIDRFKLDYSFLKKISDKGLNIGANKYQELNKADINHIIAHYDAGIAYTDNLIAGFFKDLDKANFTAKTIIFIISDHGEELLDHGSFDRFSTDALYEEIIRVLWIIKHPEIKGLSFDTPVELIDVSPTILGLLNISPEKQMQGKDLSGIIEGKEPAIADSCVFSGWDRKIALRQGEWKLMSDGSEFKLYNLNKDFKESTNVFSQNPEIAAGLLKKLFNWHVVYNTPSMGQEMQIHQDRMPELFRSKDKHSRGYIPESD